MQSCVGDDKYSNPRTKDHKDSKDTGIILVKRIIDLLCIKQWRWVRGARCDHNRQTRRAPGWPDIWQKYVRRCGGGGKAWYIFRPSHGHPKPHNQWEVDVRLWMLRFWPLLVDGYQVDRLGSGVQARPLPGRLSMESKPFSSGRVVRGEAAWTVELIGNGVADGVELLKELPESGIAAMYMAPVVRGGRSSEHRDTTR